MAFREGRTEAGKLQECGYSYSVGGRLVTCKGRWQGPFQNLSMTLCVGFGPSGKTLSQGLST